MKPVIGVLALQGGVAEHLAALERSGADARPVRRPEELAAVDGIVLPGGESTTMTRLLDTFELYEPLRERLAAGLPAYGSCAGMIMLSSEVLDEDRDLPAVRPLGALDVVVRRNAFGRQVDSFETDLDFTGIPGGPLHAVFIRAPWVEKVGSEVSVLATVPDDPDGTGRANTAGRIVAVKQGPVLATAFHPELVGGDERVHRYFAQIVRARLDSAARA
ncbi:pyridoxal 5'-phosphate synthase glutaminase subunit PdxT [Saccharopolyspora sp. K220]|uniref:pyridoxal 5'-phosphate synthase glutaminase subunit PdxT n=1 Tax=Saccharopolyspora soli TaxID=2926618 RepID=UPI001F5744C7|nr:pyridoxal 5'-phosphate synthase glutaminase subunit PdxT [Saccharopolyspora soli]MCI2420138.1 pyridoxal 5'-phosphate synthase glutaminase subunit PdxT [Saccharopolyspora soli]